MGRLYEVPFLKTGGTGTFDLLELAAPSNKVLVLHSVQVSNVSDFGEAESEVVLAIIARFATSGSGGSAATPAPLDPGDAAASFTAEQANTTQASGSSSALVTEGFNVLAGWFYKPTPEERIVVSGSNVLVIKVGPVADAIDIIGHAVVEEIG